MARRRDAAPGVQDGHAGERRGEVLLYRATRGLLAAKKSAEAIPDGDYLRLVNLLKDVYDKTD